jgi:hypothetical protein
VKHWVKRSVKKSAKDNRRWESDLVARWAMVQ